MIEVLFLSVNMQSHQWGGPTFCVPKSLSCYEIPLQSVTRSGSPPLSNKLATSQSDCELRSP